MEKQGDWYVMFYIGFRDETTPRSAWPAARTASPTGSGIRPTRSSGRAKDKWDHDACYKPYAIFDGRKWLLWYNGRHGGLEQIGVVLHEGEDLGF